MFVRLETRAGKPYAKLVRGFRDPDGKVRQRVFVLDPDPRKLRQLARRLEKAAQQLELEQTARPEPTLSGPVRVWRFLSCYTGLVLYSAPTPDGAARFVRGMLETTDPALASWLREHPDFGLRFREAAVPV